VFDTVDDTVNALLTDFLDCLTDFTAAIQRPLRSAAFVFACSAAISASRLVYAADAPGIGST